MVYGFNKLFFLFISYIYFLNTPPPIDACKMLGGYFKDNSCIFKDVSTCIEKTHVNKFNKKICTYDEYYSNICVPTNKVINLWCPQYPKCESIKECSLNKTCINGRCLYSSLQPYCVYIRTSESIIECD